MISKEVQPILSVEGAEHFLLVNLIKLFDVVLIDGPRTFRIEEEY
jgi:hypothetical protein